MGWKKAIKRAAKAVKTVAPSPGKYGIPGKIGIPRLPTIPGHINGGFANLPYRLPGNVVANPVALAGIASKLTRKGLTIGVSDVVRKGTTDPNTMIEAPTKIFKQRRNVFSGFRSR